MGARNEGTSHLHSPIKKSTSSPAFLSYLDYLIRTCVKDEKNFLSSVLTLSAVLNYDEEFSHYMRKADHLRNCEKALLKRKLFDLKQSIRHLCYLQSDQNKVGSRSVTEDLIKAVKSAISIEIGSFKEQEEAILYSLREEEHKIVQDLDILCIEGCTDGQQIKKYVARVNDFDLPFEVLEFQDFVLKNGGHLGGWSERDHYRFLWYREKCKLKKNLLKFVKSMPHLTEKAVSEHEMWYEEYLRKKRRHDAAIDHWKQEKLNSIQNFSAEVSSNKKNDENDKERLEIKERVKVWKENCIRLKNEEAKLQEHQKAVDSKKSKKKFEEHQLLLKEKLQKYKKQKEAGQVVLNYDVKQQYFDKQKDIKKMIRITQMRDEISQLERKERELLKHLSHIDSELKLQSLKETVKIDVPTDPNRVLKPTKAWIERKLCAGPDSLEKPVYLPRRHVPSWRKVVHH